MKKLRGVEMEIEDCAYKLVDKTVITDQLDVACKDIDWAVLIGGFSVKGSWKNFERDSLLSGNVPIFSQMGKAINEHAKKSVKVVVVANPANTNALTLMQNAPSIPKKNFSALTRLDHNRAISELARRLKVPNEKVQNVAIWGNHSRTQF
ncbi:Malate dehydrogenase, cytoplasmic [Bonamia ostreae]|uniref:Malate dehydrogenase n=1 Tax=Bonamia ostreae TaxID=126728 RepID=A0ABV2AGI5_9EUKA